MSFFSKSTPCLCFHGRFIICLSGFPFSTWVLTVQLCEISTVSVVLDINIHTIHDKTCPLLLCEFQGRETPECKFALVFRFVYRFGLVMSKTIHSISFISLFRIISHWSTDVFRFKLSPQVFRTDSSTGNSTSYSLSRRDIFRFLPESSFHTSVSRFWVL